MWELDRDTGMWIYRHDGYIMGTIATTMTTGAWTDSGRWLGVDSSGRLEEFEPKPRCIFDEK